MGGSAFQRDLQIILSITRKGMTPRTIREVGDALEYVYKQVNKFAEETKRVNKDISFANVVSQVKALNKELETSVALLNQFRSASSGLNTSANLLTGNAGLGAVSTSTTLGARTGGRTVGVAAAPPDYLARIDEKSRLNAQSIVG